MERTLSAENDTVINNELELIVKSRLLTFDGFWHLEEEAQGSLHDTFALPVTYDYLINIHNSNNLIYPDDLRAFLDLLGSRPRSTSIDFNIRVINAAGEIKSLRGSGIFVDTQRSKPSLADWYDDTNDPEVKLKTFEYAEEVSSAGCWRWNLHTDVLNISANLSRIFSLRLGRAMTGWEPFMQCIIPEDRERVWYALAAGKEQFKTFTVKFRVTAPDGETRFLRCKGMPYESKTHENYLIGTVQDVTRAEKFTHTIKAQQAELTEKHKLLESVIQSDIVALSVLRAIHDAQGVIVDFEWVMANKLVKAMAQGQNVIGKKYTAIFPDAVTNGSLDLMRQVMHTGERAVNEFYHQDRNVKGWFRGVYARMNDMVIVSVEDVTCEKEAGQELEKNFQILRQTEAVAGIGSWEFVIADNQFTWSEGMYTIFEMPSGTKVTPEVYVQFAAKEDKGVAEKIVHHFRADPAPFEEVITINTGSRHKTLKVKAMLICDDNNKPWKVLGVDFDITAVTEFDRLKELNSKLKELDRAKTKFFSNVSHEFRTPLTLLLGPLEDLMKHGQTLPAQDLQKLEMVHRNGIRLHKLVNTLLDFSRIEAGRLEAFFQPTDLAGFTAELAGSFRAAAEKAGLKFVVKADPGTEHAYVNREMWEKIVLNLLSNAFKFTLHGKIEVAVRSRQRYVKLYVRDTGAGIAPDDVPRIFDRFVRIEGVKARTYEGTGIGLALVKELVTLHGGSIKVKSEPGVGTTFTVTIPKGKAHLPPKQIFESTDRLPETTLSLSYFQEAASWLQDTRLRSGAVKALMEKRDTGNKPVILQADDNADMRQYLTHVLSDDYHIVAVENGKKAIDLLEQGLRPDLVLADVMMPEMDGHTLVSTMKSNERFARIPVVLLSARSGEEAKIEGIESGADDYLVKPFSPRELRALVRARIQVAAIRNLAARELGDRNRELEQRVQERTSQLEESRVHIEKQNAHLQRKNQELRVVNEELTNFAFIASHDLREPLRKIRLFTQELIDREVQVMTEKGRGYSRKILDAVTRMNALIDDILSFSRANSGRPSKLVPVNLDDQLQVVLGDLSEMIQGSSARIDYTALPVLHGNPLQLSQLLQNLIANAIKFQSPGNTPHVRILGRFVQGSDTGLPQADPDAQYFVLEVADNGIGFDEQYAEKIFLMFQRLHDKAEFPGTGMGLAICKKVVQNHKGFMTANGKPGEGAVFSCYFPV